MHQSSQCLVANKIYHIHKIIIFRPVVAAMGQQHSMRLRTGQTQFKHSRLSHWIDPITDGPSSTQLLVCLSCPMITHNTQSERSPNAFNPQPHLGHQTLLLLSAALIDPTPTTQQLPIDLNPQPCLGQQILLLLSAVPTRATPTKFRASSAALNSRNSQARKKHLKRR